MIAGLESKLMKCQSGHKDGHATVCHRCSPPEYLYTVEMASVRPWCDLFQPDALGLGEQMMDCVHSRLFMPHVGGVPSSN
ncbi:hypothetical protein RRG08_065099 [Elysia crispata]|uniref:Uncharacterized protein n=1 Tax=Elysia crispata TaxID=231223 RepID=A0AAE1DDF9_9GAST|nr:hypothetical protein RRG08_065099 [Elysia crispata]